MLNVVNQWIRVVISKEVLILYYNIVEKFCFVLWDNLAEI